MMPVLFNSEVIVYDNNGIGVLYDAISCIVTEKRNGMFEMEMEYPASGKYAHDILKNMQILAKPNDKDDPHAFRIYGIEKDLYESIIFIQAVSVTDDLRSNLVLEASVEDANAQRALNEIKANLIEPTTFDLISDIETNTSSSWERINPLQAIAGVEGSLVHRWGGEIKKTNDAVYLYSRRGKDRVTVIRPGKNINGFNMKTSTKGIVTKILPHITFGFGGLTEYEMVEDYNGEMVKRPTYTDGNREIEEITVIADVVVSDEADKHPISHYEPIDYSDDTDLMGQIQDFIEDKEIEIEESETIIDTSGFVDELKQFVYNLLNNTADGYFTYTNPGVDKPKTEITADILQLSDSPEWERYKNLEIVGLTDTVEVYIQKFDVDVEVMVTSISYDSIGERVIRIIAGTEKTSYSQSRDAKYEKRTKELEEYVSTLEHGIYNDITRTANNQTKRFRGYTEPPHEISSEGDMWFREMGDGRVDIYFYDGGVWVPKISDEVIQGIEQDLSDAKQTAQDADDKAQGVVDDITDTIDGSGFTTLADLIASKMSEDDFGTLYFQESKSIGLLYEEGGVTKSIIMIDEGTPYIKGENIVLNGNTIVDGDFTVTEEMLANDAVINKLIASGIDADEVNIVNLDVDSLTGGDIELTEGFRITNNGIPVLEVDAQSGQVKISAPNLATKDDLENIEVGGRNLILSSHVIESVVEDQSVTVAEIIDMDSKKVVLSMWDDAYKNAITEIGVMIVFKDLSYRIDSISAGDLPYFINEEDEIEAIAFYFYGIDKEQFFESKFKFEKGNKATDWTPAPEDVEMALQEKSDMEDMEDLADLISDVMSEIDDKADEGALQQMIDDFNDRVEQDIQDKEQLEEDLSTLEGRTSLVEILAEDSKLVTEFIDTVITESEEGIFIGNQVGSTGILISDERISFLDDDTEVAYISNKTMQINHGIFVKSATISGFKFEKIPGTEVLGITWVGD